MRTNQRTRQLAAGLVLVAVFAVGVGGAPAEAKSWSASGSPGNIALTATATANGATRRIIVGPSTVGAAPVYTNYWQKVCLTKRLWQIVFTASGGTGRPFWKQVSSSRACAWVTGGGAAVDDAVAFAAGEQKGYSVTIDVSWQLSNGYVIGTKSVDYDATRDYRCVNGNCIIGLTNWGGGAFVFFPNY